MTYEARNVIFSIPPLLLFYTEVLCPAVCFQIHSIYVLPKVQTSTFTRIKIKFISTKSVRLQNPSDITASSVVILFPNTIVFNGSGLVPLPKTLTWLFSVLTASCLWPPPRQTEDESSRGN